MAFNRFVKPAAGAAQPQAAPAAAVVETAVVRVQGQPAVPVVPSAAELQAQIEKAKAEMASALAAKPAEVVATPAVHGLSVIDANTDISTLLNTGMGVSGAALSAFVAEASEGSVIDSKFPVVNLTSGNGAGAGSFAPAEWTDKKFGPGTANNLPAGKKPVDGVFIGYRLEVIAWGMAYDDPARNKDDKPVYSAAIAANDAASTQLLTEAAKNYQFTKKVNKGQFDMTNSGAGHVRVALSVLVFVKDVGLVVFQTPQHYTSVERSLKSLAKQANQQTGSLIPFPAVITPTTQDDKTSTQQWKMHHLNFDLSVSADSKAAYQQFDDWRKNVLPNDADMQKDVRDFLGALDNPIDEKVKKALTIAANI